MDLKNIKVTNAQNQKFFQQRTKFNKDNEDAELTFDRQVNLLANGEGDKIKDNR